MTRAEIVGVARIEQAIRAARGQRVILDEDLALLYGVDVRTLNQAVNRNLERFPEDFMFRLTAAETKSLRSQIVTIEKGRGRHRKYLPTAFTEQGVAMLSSVLRSPRAIEVNIEIMRTFVRLRRLLLANADFARKLAALEKKTDSRFQIVFAAIEELMNPSPAPKKKIGFVSGKRRT